MAMTTLFAAFHYIALAVGFAGITLRTLHLKQALNGTQNIKQIFFADNLWGIAALMWIATGLMRAFGGLEKGSPFYLQSHWFWLKMVLFLLVFLLEFRVMIKLIQWRIKKKVDFVAEDKSVLRSFYRSSQVQVPLILIIVVIASVMARGGIH